LSRLARRTRQKAGSECYAPEVRFPHPHIYQQLTVTFSWGSS
jgi:hypothetical protein